MSDATEAVVRAFADETRKHRDALESGGVSRLLVEVRIARDGEARARPAKVNSRHLQSGGDSA